jgi:hypothetical protein
LIKNSPIPGTHCWAVDSYHDPLPEGLADRTPAVIISWHEFRGDIRDASGKVWNLNLVQLDAGYSCYLDGVCRDENHPEHIAYLYGCLARYHGDPDPSRFESDISRTRWVLERNGHDPDAPAQNLKAPRATGTPIPKRLPSPMAPMRPQDAPRRMRS